jgi:pyruvate dehydrogenase E1 component
VLASGIAMPWALEAQRLLGEEWNVDVDVWSVTSWNELRRDAVECEQANLLDPSDSPAVPYVTRKLADSAGPVIAVSDFMRAVPDQISRWVPADYTSLGADGFGFADTRGAARRFFHIDAQSIVVAVLEQLAKTGAVKSTAPREAIERYRLLDVHSAEAGSTAGDS